MICGKTYVLMRKLEVRVEVEFVGDLIVGVLRVVYRLDVCVEAEEGERAADRGMLGPAKDEQKEEEEEKEEEERPTLLNLLAAVVPAKALLLPLRMLSWQNSTKKFLEQPHSAIFLFALLCYLYLLLCLSFPFLFISALTSFVRDHLDTNICWQ